MILESVENGPLIWPTVEENGVIRTKKYAKLSAAEKIQADFDMKATNIILQGKRVLPPEWSKFVTDVKLVKDLHTTNFDQLHAYLEQHELHANEVRLLREHNQYPLAFVSPQATTQPMAESPLVDSSFTIPVFSPGDDPIACLNKLMAFLTVSHSATSIRRQGQSYSGTGYKSNATSSGGSNASGQARVVKCYNCQAEAQEAGQILAEEQLAFPADPGVLDGQAVQTIIPNNVAFQTEDLDTYDSDCDDVSNAKAVLMANISNYGFDVISEVHHSETYLYDIENQSVHAMQDFEQTPVMDVTDNEITSDSNIILYS
ncbi:hypothetical protein Tco_0598184 [Tanacetum coccineum]